MKNKELALLFEGLSWLLSNQVRMMKTLNIGTPYISDNSGELSKQYDNLANAYYNEYKSTREELIELLDRLKEEDPSQEIIVETPNGTVTLKIGDANIYEGMRGELVIDSE